MDLIQLFPVVSILPFETRLDIGKDEAEGERVAHLLCFRGKGTNFRPRRRSMPLLSLRPINHFDGEKFPNVYLCVVVSGDDREGDEIYL